jgi:hypothetical protein
MRALHAFLTTVAPLVILSACGGPPPPETTPSESGQDGSRILSLQLRLRDGRVVEVKTPYPDIDAVFTSVAVLDSILIPYYDGKGTSEDSARADSLRDARDVVGNPHAYVAHRLHSRSLVIAIE